MNVLLPIRPRYADAIMDGEKRFEFRRRPFRARPDVVVVYSTSPVQQVIGWFTVEEMIESDPHDLWERFGAWGSIDKSAFDAYFDGSKGAMALRIGEVFKLKHPMPLEELTGSRRPPQAFQYIDAVALAGIVARENS